MAQLDIACPVCRISLPPASTTCPDCGEDLTLLVRIRLRSLILYHCGLQQAKAGQLDRAILTMNQALAADATNVDTMAVLGKLYAQSGRYEQAREAWQRCLACAPEMATAQAGLAQLDGVRKAPRWEHL